MKNPCEAQLIDCTTFTNDNQQWSKTCCYDQAVVVSTDDLSVAKCEQPIDSATIILHNKPMQRNTFIQNSNNVAYERSVASLEIYRSKIHNSKHQSMKTSRNIIVHNRTESMEDEEADKCALEMHQTAATHIKTHKSFSKIESMLSSKYNVSTQRSSRVLEFFQKLFVLSSNPKRKKSNLF